MSTAEPTRRVFFALWPDAELRAALEHATHEAVRACGGRPVPAQNLHVTLLFLGSVAAARIPELVTLAARAAGRLPDKAGAGLALDWDFDSIEFWEKARVLVATTSSTLPSPDAVSGLTVATALAGSLLQETHRAGFIPDLKTVFRPHVTLAQKAQHAPRFMRMEPVTWSYTDFVLVESQTLPQGSVYTVLHRLPLGR